MTLYCRAFLFCLALAGGLSTQSMADEFDDMRADFDQFGGSNAASFQQFKDANDAAYVKWLSQQWKEYEAVSGLVRDATPKLKKAPKVPELSSGAEPPHKPNDAVSTEEPVIDHKAPNAAEALAAPVAKVLPASQVMQAKEKLKPQVIAKVKNTDVPKAKSSHKPKQRIELHLPEPNLQFYQQAVYLPSLDVALGPIRNNKDIARDWGVLASAQYQPLLEQIKARTQELKLSDWAVMQLVEGHAQQLYTQPNQQQLYLWFVLNKLGHKVTGGLSGERLMLLFASEQTVYERPYFRFNGDRYYSLNGPKNVNLRLPPKPFPAPLHSLDLRFGQTLVNAQEIETRNITVANTTFAIDTVKPRNHFFNGYPLLALKHYFNTPIASVTAESLRRELMPHLSGKSQVEQVNWLLQWMHQGFEYQLDDKQFGYENYLHPEENFRFAANDCEDRAFIFSWLVRELVGLPVVGLVYPGHVATAVAFSKVDAPKQGQPFTHKGKDFWVADPTYIGAKAGRVMPQYRRVIPEVI